MIDLSKPEFPPLAVPPPVRPRLVKKTQEFLAQALTDHRLNRTELLTVFATKGKREGLHDGMGPSEVEASQHSPGPDPYAQERARILALVEPQYPRIRAYMTCPARVYGPAACIHCPPRLLVPCVLDNHHSLGDIDMDSAAKMTFISSMVRQHHWLPAHLLKLPGDSPVFTVIKEQLEKGNPVFLDLDSAEGAPFKARLAKVNVADPNFQEQYSAIVMEAANGGAQAAAPAPAAADTPKTTRAKATKKADPPAPTTPAAAPAAPAAAPAETPASGTAGVDFSQVHAVLRKNEDRLQQVLDALTTLTNRLQEVQNLVEPMAGLVVVTAARQQIAETKLDATLDVLQSVFQDMYALPFERLNGILSVAASGHTAEALADLDDDALTALAIEAGLPASYCLTRQGVIEFLLTT